jgi:serine/threonine protein kinase
LSQSSGDWFSRYKFRQPLGQGGMGVIYLAEDRSRDGTLCVVKQLILNNTEGADYIEAVRLFKREAEMLSKMDHPGIVRMFDFHVTEDGKYFLVMDYVPGKNLSAVIKNYGAFNSEATAEIGIQCCEILEYLHDCTPPIIYRDLKPSNLMLTPEGQIVFIDFGIARDFAPKTEATRVVTTGYSPPEQYFGRPETRSDLYALGATLGELLTGLRPKALSTSAPKNINKSVLSSLDDLIQRLTSHSPENRPASARIVRYELYRIYNEIHPDFVVPSEALIPGGLTASDRSIIEQDMRASSSDRIKALQSRSKQSHVRMGQQASQRPNESKLRLQASRRAGATTTVINDSILWDGIKRILQLFKREK